MRRASSASAIDIVEVAYRAASREPASWAERVLTAMQPMLDTGLGVITYEFDTNRPVMEWVSEPTVRGGDPALGTAVLNSFANANSEWRDRIYRRAMPVVAVSAQLGTGMSRNDYTGRDARALGVEDMLKVTALDPSGRGTCFCSPRATVVRGLGSLERRWSNVAAHLATAGRLRAVLARAAAPSAVISAEGRVVHAEGEARLHLHALTSSARRMDRARAGRHRRDPESLASWRALVSGRWSLVEEIESDGRRFLLAHANAPSVSDPRRLSTVERLVAGYAALGHADKLIAYELGLALGTVSCHMNAVRRKLGVRTRVEIVARLALLSTGSTHRVDLAGDALTIVASRKHADARSSKATAALTDAEQRIARLAARGASNEEIARLRGRSPNTIKNQLAQIFAKLGVRSRSELAQAMSDAPAPAPVGAD